MASALKAASSPEISRGDKRESGGSGARVVQPPQCQQEKQHRGAEWVIAQLLTLWRDARADFSEMESRIMYDIVNRGDRMKHR